MKYKSIELSFFIANIWIIAAILFPVFSSAREKARQSACASNEKQLGRAFIQYMQDNDERLPYGSGTGSGSGWACAIYPYVNSAGVYACPDDPTVAGAGDNTISYEQNLDFANGDGYSVIAKPISINSFRGDGGA